MTTERTRRDLALVDACIAGSLDAWAEIVDRHRDDVRFAILHTFRRHSVHADDAVVEDIEAAVLLGLVVDDFRRLRQFRGQAGLKAWIKVLAANATVDHLRRNRPVVSIGPGEPFDVPAPEPSAEDALARAQLIERMRELWDALPPADAEFVELHFVRELGFEEIARRTGTTVGALYARKNRIRHKLLERARAEGLLDRRSR